MISSPPLSLLVSTCLLKLFYYSSRSLLLLLILLSRPVLHFAVVVDLLLLEARWKHNFLEALSFLQSAMQSEIAMLLLMLALSLSSGQVTLPDNGPTFNSMPSDPALQNTETRQLNTSRNCVKLVIGVKVGTARPVLKVAMDHQLA